MIGGANKSLLVTENDLKFRSPFGMILSGPTGSGKTTLLMKLLTNRDSMITPPPASVLFCYGEFDNHVVQLQQEGITVCSGLPTDQMLRECEKPCLLILDDLLSLASERFLTDLFTKKSHHQNISVIFVTQNLYEKNIKVARNNSQYIILTRTAHMLQIRTIAQQLFPRQLDYMLSAYKMASDAPYGYLLLDLHPATNPLLRLRTRIFPDDDDRTIYLPKTL
ncbi:hypothetical protein DdX_21977 [Ditylenchus destructor]|uniref:AAA+ ATPase domain-containing protein n=1 Tax=Ditylenchus destructor TaxID=166010 RepID=A0AAD4ME63_9BILA|nr:hypothetical protein DdX_21977 [Ditylenchus destructor]